jgi:uncharacterized protein DUF4129
MPRRLDKTLADYITIAISPMLIMALVGSLVFFLQEVFYQGRYDGRVSFILGLFVMAIVLIGRISIEEGNERAVLFAIPLAVAFGLAIVRFGDGGLLHFGLMALCWWSAHKLTWDCTVIDEEKDASGQGLLQIVGLDGSGQAEFETADKEPDEEEEIVASYTPVTASWEREEKKKRKPHAPGVWIVYFSLAALPLFGLGQRFIPTADVESRRYAFMLLLVYVASGLGLLLTTSFLGLRRYLRQRRVEMPVSMATVWITSGAVLIVVLLLFAALLPRPAAEYAISKVPLSFGSPERKSSKYAMGSDGADQNSAGSKSATTGNKSQSDDKQSDQERKSSGSSDSRQGSDDDRSPPDNSQQGGDSGDDKSKPGKSGKPSDDGKGDSGKSSGQGKSQEGKSREGKSGEAKSRESKSREGKSQQSKQSDQDDSRQGKSSKQAESAKQGKQQDASQDDPSQSGDSDRPDKPSDSSQESSQERDKSDEPSDRDPGQDSPEDPADDKSSTREDSSEDTDEEESDQQPSFSFQKLFSGLIGILGAILKWLFYIVVLLIALYWLVRSWKTVMAAWAQFLKELAEFWRRLFGGKPTPDEETVAEEERKPAPRPFADFADPFTTGMASRYSPDELVKYTFEAVEAWARENGFPRGPEQTPHEFARQLAGAAKPLEGNSRTLADLYCYVAYAPGRLRAERTKALAQLWQQLRSGTHLQQPVEKMTLQKP